MRQLLAHSAASTLTSTHTVGGLAPGIRKTRSTRPRPPGNDLLRARIHRGDLAVGRGEFLFNADGTIRFRLAGQAFTAFADPEAEMMGLAPGIYLIKGRLEILYDENFEALAVTKNRLVVRDLCAELTPSA